MGADRPIFLAGLGPVAVDPGRQSAGAGSALIRGGVEALRRIGVDAIIVLGHPTYYPRFGFSAEAAANVASPYAGRPSFMAMELWPRALERPLRADYPPAFGPPPGGAAGM
jgi:putative acetyltransferase